MSGKLRTLRARVLRARTRERRQFWTRSYLRAKARAGIWDARMLSGHQDVRPEVRPFIMRAVAAGLIVTSTTGGRHAPTSYHYSGRAVDVGNRIPGTRAAQQRLVRFQRAEAAHPKRFLELFGPDNNANVKHGRRISLAEGSGLEQLHDDHVHGAPA